MTKDLYGRELSGTSSSKTPKSPFETETERAAREKQTHTLDLYGSPAHMNVEDDKRQLIQNYHLETVQQNVRRSSIWNVIFGPSVTYPSKRGSKLRWSGYTRDITVVDVVRTALTSSLIIVVPLFREQALQEQLRYLSVQAAINNESNGPKYPPEFNIQQEIEKKMGESFTSEFTKQISIVALRKLMLQVVRKCCKEKFADKFIREFYPKLRRTINR